MDDVGGGGVSGVQGGGEAEGWDALSGEHEDLSFSYALDGVEGSSFAIFF